MAFAAAWLNAIKNDESLQLVATSMKALMSDLKEWSLPDVTIGLTYLARRHAQASAAPEAQKGDPVTLDAAFHKQLARYCRLALAAYCSSDEGLFKATGLARADLFWSSWRSTTHRPAFYMAVDNSTRSVVLVIRGTKEVRDALTDLTATVHAFQGGYVHMGILMAALWFKQHVTKLLHSHMKLHRGCTLRIIGHSLGAGTAALLATMLQHEFPGLECYAFAPPACCSEAVLPLTTGPAGGPFGRPLVTSVVLQDDLVPRFCTASIAGLRGEVVGFEWGQELKADLERSRLGQLARRSQEAIKEKLRAAERESPTLVGGLFSGLRTVVAGAERLRDFIADKASEADQSFKISESAKKLWAEAAEWRERRAAAAAAAGPAAAARRELVQSHVEDEWTVVAAATEAASDDGWLDADPYAIPLQELDPGREELREAGVVSSEAQARRNMQLYPPGAILHVVRGPSGAPTDFRALRSEAAAFAAIRLSGTMFKDHVLENYVAAIEALPFRVA